MNDKAVATRNAMGKTGKVALGIYNFLLLALSVWFMMVFWPERYELKNTSALIKKVEASIDSLSGILAQKDSILRTLPPETETEGARTLLPYTAGSLQAEIKALQNSIDAKSIVLDSLQTEYADMNNGYAPKSFGKGFDVSAEVCFFLIVILAGILGSLIHSIYHFVYRVGNKSLERSWLSWHLMRPLWGAALALVFYLVVRGGVVVAAREGFDSLSPYGLAGVAAIVGFASRQAISKLNSIFKLLFQKTEAEADPGSPQDTGQRNGGNNDGGEDKPGTGSETTGTVPKPPEPPATPQPPNDTSYPMGG